MPKKPEFILRRLVMKDGQQIRVYDNRIHAGVGIDPGDVEYTMTDAIRLLHTDGVDSFTTEVVGDCMSDAGISEGDTVVLDMKVEPTNGCIVAAYVDDVPMLRYFVRDERLKDVVWLVPANVKKNYQPVRVDATTQWRLLGVVVSCVKNFRKREFGVVSRLRATVNSQMKQMTEPVRAEAQTDFAAVVIDVDRKKKIIQALHSQIDGRKGKDVALVVQAAMQAGLIRRPTHAQMVAEFGAIGDKAGYSRYMNYEFFDYELETVSNKLKDFIYTK